MSNQNGITYRFPVRGRLALAPLVFLWGALSYAQTVTGSGTLSYPNVITGPKTEFQTLVARAENIDRFSAAVDTTGKLNTSASAKLANGTAVTVGGTMAKTAVSAAIGRFLLKGLPLLGTGVALYDLANELDYKLTNTAGGVPTVEKYSVPGCSASCVEWPNMRSKVGPDGTTDLPIGSYTWNNSAAAACQTIVGTVFKGQLVVAFNSVDSSGCYYSHSGWGGNKFWSNGSRAKAPYAPSGLGSSSAAALEAEIASKSGWPSGSALARTTVAAIKAGDSVQVDPGTVTGPSTSAGPVTTSTASDGKVTTNTTTNNYTYNTNSVTNNQSTVTTLYNPGTGATTTERTDTKPAEEPAKSECDEHPDIAGCAQLDTPTVDIPNSTANVSYTAETPFAGDGSCPANVTTTLHSISQTVTVWNWTNVCSQAVLVRWLVVGLASFAAFLIVTPGKEVRT